MNERFLQQRFGRPPLGDAQRATDALATVWLRTLYLRPNRGFVNSSIDVPRVCTSLVPGPAYGQVDVIDPHHWRLDDGSTSAFVGNDGSPAG